MNRYGKRCVLYPRVSTEMQVDGYSLEGQKNMLTRFADREEMIVVDTYEDAGKSGKSIEGRPAFQKMLRDIEDGLDIDYILVYKLSRFGRNAADILNSLELVQSYGVNLICIEEGIDSSQTSGKLLISVLSAVAEIERENIIEQTMNGRREKARQGGWNGGFAPYGYTLEDNKLMIEETEAVAIRKIFELYTSSEIGLGGIANQLNLQGIRKIPRQNGTLEDWTGHFIKLILDNPVYCGKIAYGRRTKEKVKGTKNDYQMKRNDDYILTEGQHKGIVSEEVWEKAHAKRLRTGVKQPSKIGRDRVHLLSGLLKCPVCGSPMYTNKHAWTNKDGTYKEIYYYVCSRNRMVRGKHCEYKAMLKKTDIEPMVIEAIREIVRNEEYAQAIKERIGVQIDTKAVDKELEGYQAKLKEVDLNKTRLEREIDSLPADAKYRERKLHDMTLRLDSLYDVIVELEEKIEDARLRRDAIKQQAITLENIYKIMVNFDCVYNIINDEEKRNVVTALIKEIEIYRNDESEYPLKRIGLNFPVFKDGGEVTELLWDKGNTVEAMAVFRVERNTGYTVMSNHHLRNKELSLKAKGLLSQMLSLPEDWDYTLSGLSYINRESIDAIRTAVWELEKAGYITRRQGRDEKGKMTAIEYTIYEQPQPPELDCPVLENPTADNPILENPTTDNPTSENPTQLNKDISRTNLPKKEKSNTDLSITHSIPIHSLNPLPYGEDEAAQPPERKGTERNDAYRVYEEIIKDNIEYNILLQDMKFDHDRLNEIVDIILETVCTSRKKIRIAGDDYPAELVKSKFMKLNSEHIRFVLDCMQENTTKIRNIKQYLKAVLFNAPSTIDSYYTSLVAHDMASGALAPRKPKYGDPDYYTYNEGESL